MAQLMLRPRLQTVADLVPAGTTLLDVGTDHGRLPAALMQQGRVSGAVATDVEEGPLRRAARTLQITGLSDRVILLRRDGLFDIAPDTAETITMTGMGGETIAQILEPHTWPRQGKTLLLQPTTGADALRLFLEKSGYQVEKERLTEDAGRLYQTLLCRGGIQQYRHPVEYYTGTRLIEDPLFPKLLMKLEKRFAAAVSGLKKTEAAPERRQFYQELLEEVRRMQQWKQ